MQVARALLLAALCCSLACGAAAWRRGPTAAFRLFCNTRWAAEGHARLLACVPLPTRRRRRRGAHSPAYPGPASTFSAFDGLDQPNWRHRLEREVLPAIRQGYNIDVPPARVPVSSLAACGCTKLQRSNASSI